MPSPFPGMDPHLEDPGLWRDVHSRLIDVTSELLLAQLRPRYFVQIEERIYLADETDEGRDVIVPDIHIKQVQPTPSGKTQARGGVAVAPGIEVDAPWSLEIRAGRLAIVDRELQRVVTVLEFLSPANKVKGSAGKRSYDEKKREILSSDTSLVEIDLLREGVPLYSRPGLDRSEYFAQIWRWTGERHRRFIWPLPLTEPLKTIPIPVRPGDGDGSLDFQLAINTVYDRAGYDLRIDYQKDPQAALNSGSSEWARSLIIAMGRVT